MEGGLEQEQQEAELNQRVNEEEVRSSLSWAPNKHPHLTTLQHERALLHLHCEDRFTFAHYSLKKSFDELRLSLLTCHSGLQVRSQLGKVRAELETQSQHTARLESSCRALERSLGQSGKRLQVSSDSAYCFNFVFFFTPKPEN